MGLPGREESMTIDWAVLIQYQRVTDGQTDVQPIAITCFSIADARKNTLKYFEKFVIWRHHVYKVEYIAYQLGYPTVSWTSGLLLFPGY